ncbi:MAG: ABC transporter substrate-binding protein [Erysipelotrichaceae bacterium]
MFNTKKMMKALIAGSLMLTAAACSSGNDTPDTQDANKITIWAWDPNFNIDIMNQAKDRYVAKGMDVEIEIVDFAKADLEQKLHTILASGSTSDLPDVVLIEDYNAQKYLQSYPGAFADLSNDIPYSDFAPYKAEVMTLDGKQYGVPFDSGVTGLYYRLDLVEEAGYTEADMMNLTVDKFLEIAKAVKDKTGKYMVSNDTGDLGYIRIMIQGASSWWFDDSGNPNFVDNDALRKTLEFNKQMMDDKTATQHNGWAEFLKGWNSGEVASVTTGVWVTPSVEAEESQSGNWRVAPTPKLDASGVNASNLGGSSWYVLDKGAGRDTAIAFLKDTFTDVEFYDQILIKNGAVATYKNSQTSEAYNQEIEFFGGQAIFADFAKWIQEIPPVNFGMYTYEAEDIAKAKLQDYYNGKISLDDYLSDVESQVKAQINN